MDLGKEYIGPLWRFEASNEITDIDYTGKEIWLTNIFNERFRANQQFVTQYMTPAFVEQFTQRIANVVLRGKCRYRQSEIDRLLEDSTITGDAATPEQMKRNHTLRTGGKPKGRRT